MDHRVSEILTELASLESEESRAGMARYGINVERAFGVSVYELRRLAKRFGTDHDLSLSLWATGYHEARLLACFVGDPAQVTPEQMESWARDFDSWDVCDQATTSLFDLTPHAWTKALEWAGREEEWVKRSGFALMAGLAVHDKTAPDRAFVEILPLIERGAFDPRNFVKKAVNWALRNTGKRNRVLNEAAVVCAERIRAAANERAGGTGAATLRPAPRAGSPPTPSANSRRSGSSHACATRKPGPTVAPSAPGRLPAARSGTAPPLSARADHDLL